jgi:hypothetical protein
MFGGMPGGAGAGQDVRRSLEALPRVGLAFWQDFRVHRRIDDAIAGASAGQIIVYCVPYSHADICNGGFHQYFSNHTGDD